MIDKIKNALSELDDRVLYGVCKKKNSDTWDCLVIRKERLAKSGTSGLDESYYISVRIVRENIIPDGLEHEVVKKMKNAGFRRTSKDIEYDYTVDSSETVVEIATIEFVKPAKRACV